MAQVKQRTARKAGTTPRPASALGTRLSPGRALALPLALPLLLLAFTTLPAVPQHWRLLWSFLGAVGGLLLWTGVLLVTARRAGRTLVLEPTIRAQHYLQACAHTAIYVYWGAYWHQVYDAAYLIAAQMVFAYAFGSLLSWSRSDSYALGFGPFPIIFSTNLFLWFKPDWFYLQFLMIAVGFLAKELIRWNKGGRMAHVFNPSSFPLSVFSLALLLTGSTHLTWGQEIATTQILPPHIYLLIFLVALPGQFLFGVASMTLAAVATTALWGLAYYLTTGSYYFFEPSIPIAVFLGMHLLFTDPSTSPQTDLGRLFFGVLYGASVIALYSVLGRLGVPTFYDKLLGVPVLNLMIRAIDQAVRSNALKRYDPGAADRGVRPPRRNLAYIGIWAVTFVVLQLATSTAVTFARADVLAEQGRMEEAINRYREVMQADPQRVEAYNKLGFALMRTGRPQEAVTTLRRASDLQPGNADTHNNLGLALMQTGRPQDAVQELRRTVELRPGYAEGRYNLAQALVSTGQPPAAIVELREALRLRPEWATVMGALAWLQVTTTDPAVHNPEEALQLATRAAELSGRREVAVLDALAAAYAAVGRFPDAVRTAEDAETLARSSAPNALEDIKARLSRYKEGRPLVTAGR